MSNLTLSNNVRNEEGSATEKFVAKTFKKAGYWALIIPKKVNGQPCDVVAGKGSTNSQKTLMWLVDAKHVRAEEVSFPFDRIEPNQITSMAYAMNFAKINGRNIGFAIFFERTKKLYWFSYQDYIRYSQWDYKSVNMNELLEFEEVLKDENNY